MKQIIPILILISFLFTGLEVYSQKNKKKVTFNSEIDSLSYALGMMVGENYRLQGIEVLNQEAFMKGLDRSFFNKKTKISVEEAHIYVQNYFNSINSIEAKMNLEAGNIFLEENKMKDGVVTLESGLQYKVINEGEGDPPGLTDSVKVHYTGTLIDGSVFDSSVQRGEPIVFGVTQVIAGWTEALQLMKPGAKWILYIPPGLAYGERGAGGVIGPNSTLIFEVELLKVIK